MNWQRYTPNTQGESDLVNDNKSDDEISIPSPARGKVLVLIPESDLTPSQPKADNNLTNTLHPPCTLTPASGGDPAPSGGDPAPSRGAPAPGVSGGDPAVDPAVDPTVDPHPIQNTKNRVIAASDIEALYPSLDVRAVKKTVFKHVFKTKVEFKDISYRDAAEYIAACAKPWEIRLWKLHDIVPTKKNTKGKHNMTRTAQDPDTPWAHKTRDPTEYELKALFAAAVAIGVQACFDLHTYQFGGETYHQQGGSPIGVDLSGDVAELEVVDWTNMMMAILDDNKIETDEDFIYVDDGRQILPPINNGWEYNTNTKKFTYCKDLHQHEDQSNISPTRKTVQELGKVYNSIKPHLKFTLECEEDFSNRRLPTLDCELWMEGDKVMTAFFEKPTKTPYCILATTAMPQQMIENSMVQEVVRRLVNTSMELKEEKVTAVEGLIKRMRRSGHSIEVTGRVVGRGLQTYQRKAENHMRGVRKMNRSGRESLKDRREKKLTIKKSWFTTNKTNASEKPQGRHHKPPNPKVTRDNRSPDAAIFVPRAPRGALATLLKQAESDLAKVSAFKLKVVEECGRDLKDTLMQSNPWAREDCNRQDCLLCLARREGDDQVRGNCKTKSVTYSSTCTLCKREGRETQYIGESGRSLYERSKEHYRQALSKSQNSHIREHLENQHPGANPEPGTFRFSVTGSYYSALDRQLSEAIKIQRASTQKTTVLNSKFEFNRCLIPTIVTEDTKTKPYHTNLRYERDPDEPEEEEWDENENPQKRQRNQEVRRKQPTKRRKPNNQDEQSDEPQYENQTHKRKPIQEVRKPTNNNKKRKESRENENQQPTNNLRDPQETQPNTNQTKTKPILSFEVPTPCENKVANNTLPESTNSDPSDVTLTDQSTALSKLEFMKRFSREGPTTNGKKRPRSNKVKRNFEFQCQDIRKFYTCKLQPPKSPPPASPNPGKVSNKSEMFSPPPPQPPGTDQDRDKSDFLTC